MKKTVSFIVACVFAVGASYAASEKQKPQQAGNQTIVAIHSTDSSVVNASAGAPDYRLERESCCGPQ